MLRSCWITIGTPAEEKLKSEAVCLCAEVVKNGGDAVNSTIPRTFGSTPVLGVATVPLTGVDWMSLGAMFAARILEVRAWLEFR